MTTVYFVRHARPNFDNRNDRTRELTGQGMKDRRLVTEFLKDKSIHCVFSSPFKRSVDTVKEFADLYGLEIKLIEDFRERKVDSVWIEAFEEFSRKQWQDFHFKYADGESLAEVQKRNIDALNLILREDAGKNIVIGSHGTALSTIINFYDNTFGYAEFEQIKSSMPWIVRFSFQDKECLDIQTYDLFKN